MDPAYLKLPNNHCFDYRLLLDALRGYRSPRDKISLMLSRGEIARLRKGLYVRSREYGGTAEPVEVANVLYGPSYVSLEYALSHYGMIPEGVVEITNVTSKRTRRFTTPLGRFSYRHIPAKAFHVGVALERRGQVGMLMATREKAVCDKLASVSHIRTMEQIDDFLIEDQRIDEGDLAGLSLDLLREIAAAYGMQRLGLLVRWFQKRFGRKDSPR
jgi:predicted transcriptional regulator of viral defense system